MNVELSIIIFCKIFNLVFHYVFIDCEKNLLETTNELDEKNGCSVVVQFIYFDNYVRNTISGLLLF